MKTKGNQHMLDVWSGNPEDYERDVEAAIQTPSRLTPVGFREMVDRRVQFRWLVKNYLPQNSFAVLYGDKGTGKSFFALDMLMHIAMGKPWRGRKVDQAGVIIQVGEGGDGVPKRLQAWVQENGDPGDIPLAIINKPVNFLDPNADIESFIEAAKQQEKKWGVKLGVFAIDTLARAMIGGSDTDGSSMGQMIHNVDRARSALDCSALMVHHTGKDASRGARGHSSLGGAADCMFELVRSETGLITVRVEKQKDEASGIRDFFRLRRTVVGLDDDGEEIASCVVTEAEKLDIKESVKLKGIAKIAMECLVQTLLDHGEEPNSNQVPRGCRAVKWQTWKDRCVASGIALTDDVAKQNSAFLAAGRILKEKGCIGVASPWVWDCRPKAVHVTHHLPVEAPVPPAPDEIDPDEIDAVFEQASHSAPKLTQ
jgi:hypothetical protein